uniref:Uncharacterized protein n=1 Tax=Lepeophtheirus salmonis TaxID=72036 RepID=A0A0K2TZT1_LEPSM
MNDLSMKENEIHRLRNIETRSLEQNIKRGSEDVLLGYPNGQIYTLRENG